MSMKDDFLDSNQRVIVDKEVGDGHFHGVVSCCHQTCGRKGIATWRLYLLLLRVRIGGVRLDAKYPAKKISAS